MAMSSNRWKAISESPYPWEREALEFIRERLPDHEPYRAWANFEFIADDGSVNEVDLLAVTPKGFFLVEIKSRPGLLKGDAGTWTWETEGRYFTDDNPLIGANTKAKKLSSLLKRQKAAQKGKERLPFLEALVFCSAPDLENRLSENGRTRVCLRDRPEQGDRPPRPGIIAALQERKAYGLRETISTPINRPTAKIITRAMEAAGIRESQKKRRVGDFQLNTIIEEGPGYQDWHGTHVTMPEVERRVRIYLVRKAAAPEERATIQRAATREFQLLENLQHPGVLQAHTPTEHELGPAIIFEYFPNAMRLDLFLTERGHGLEPDHRLDFLRQISETVQHAHEQRVVHRALSPQSILVINPEDPFPKIKVYNWQAGFQNSDTGDTGGRITATRHVDQLVEDKSTAYMAPEALNPAEEGGEHLDVFSLGAIAFHLFSNQPPAANALELSEKLRAEKGLQISAAVNGAGEALQELIQYSTHPDVTSRLDTVKEFLEYLDLVEEELTTPDEQKETVEDPTQAVTGDRLAGGYEVVKRLGSGASSVGFLVTFGDRTAILKVALDPDHNDRLRKEAAVIQKLRHPRVVAHMETIEIGGRVGILLRALTRSLKGRDEVETLRQWLHQEGRLQLDLLQRFGEDLLSAVKHLEELGINHRDIKPDNLAVANVGAQDMLHLVLFDFSLSTSPIENIRVGTRGYMDPFLPLRKYKKWDSYAERWSAAVTLYEMATGRLPVWHDGKTDPLQVECEAAIDAELFETDLRDELARFFKKALRRDPYKRFDNAEQMLRAWRQIFEALDQPTISTSDHDETVFPPDFLQTARRDTQIPELGLTTRAANALDRLNVLTVDDLLRVPIRRLYRMRGVGQKTRREITNAVHVLRDRLDMPNQTSAEIDHTPPETEAEDATPSVPSVDFISGRLTPMRETRSNASQIRILKTFLGLAEGGPDGWPTQAETGRHLDLTRARIGQVVTKAIQGWSRHTFITGLRGDMASILQANGGVMTLREMADAVLTARGSIQEEPVRSRLAGAAVRAAVEVERTLAEPRFLVRRDGDRILIASGAELAEYGVRLGNAADRLASEDPLLPPGRVIERLQEVHPPSEGEVLLPGRLLRLAAAASTQAAVSGRQEIYPRGMAAGRALKLSQGALLGMKRLTVRDIQERVLGRYPEAAPLPGRPELDRLLMDAGLELEWNPEADGGRGAYLFPRYEPEISGTGSRAYRYSTGSADGAGPAEITPEIADARQFEERLRHSRADGGFVALTVPPRWYPVAMETLERRFKLRVCHLENLFLDALMETARAKRVDWNKVVEADAAPPESRDWQRLLQLVGMAMPRIEAQLFHADDYLLLCYAGFLARYDQMGLLNELRERAGRPAANGGIPGVWLLIPGDGQSRLPLMEGQAVPVISSGQHARVPESWLKNRHRSHAAGGSRRKVNGCDD